MIERAKARAKLIRPLLLPLVLYIGFLAFAMNWLDAHPESGWRYPVALTPIVPGIWIVIGVARAIQRLDEMERLVLLEGIAVSFMGTLILVLSLGFLQIAGFPTINSVYIGFFMTVLWLLAKLAIHRRYE
jgi:uncharacterized membrane protein (DUF485 family)